MAGKYDNPVVPLVLALYGHPDAGGLWERHCETHLKKVGFSPVDNWLSTFWHNDLRLLLVVYVDDFAFAVDNPQQFVDTLCDRHNFKLRPISYHLGANSSCYNNGTLCMLPEKYIPK